MRLWILLALLLVLVTALEAKKRDKDRKRDKEEKENNKGNRGQGRGHHGRDQRRGGGRAGRRDGGRTADIEFTAPHSGQRVRLGGSLRQTKSSGNVEVYLRHKWGIVCDDEWSKTDANVVCRQLGFSGAYNATEISFFGDGGWLPSDVLMDNVRCHGNEAALHQCHYVFPGDCSGDEEAGVVCSEYTGCPEKWVAGPDSCYSLSSITTTQLQYAKNKCEKIGGHLVNIETEAENHFLSLMFADQPGEPIITGAFRTKKAGWMWEKKITSTSGQDLVDTLLANVFRHRRSPRGQRRGSSRGSSRSFSHTSSSTSSGTVTTTSRTSIDFFKWFPGWLPGNENSEPTDKKNDRCIYLKSAFNHPDKSRGQVDVGYLFWDDDFCKRTKRRLKNGFRFLCEKPREPADRDPDNTVQTSSEDCYSGNGASYRGTFSITEKGTPCISWAASKSEQTPYNLPDMGLEGNYCRNPDNDSRPWCYVNNMGSFGFCPIPRCSETQSHVTTIPSTTPSTTPMPECPDNNFYCSESYSCINEQWHCDHESDCEKGEDEVGCEYKLTLFKKISFSEIAEEHVRETYVGVTNETCAKFCMRTQNFVCRSFMFVPRERQCSLSDTNTQRTGRPGFSLEGSVFELISQLGDCTNDFRCGNQRCISRALVCNQEDDCGDLTDELDCGVKAEPVQVRLVDGDEHSGRLELKYGGEWGVVCDDNWDNDDAAVVCHMLGYTKLSSAKATTHSKYGSGNGKFLLDEVECVGIEQTIEECPHNGWKVHNCRSFEVAGVVCESSKGCAPDQFSCSTRTCIPASSVCDGICQCLPGCEDENGAGNNTCQTARLELVDGNQPGSGRVEIIRNGLRGTVCDDSWGNNEATVLCRMLGFKYGEGTTGGSFGEGEGPIWLDDVTCVGTERSLSECQTSRWGVSDCTHSEDAGVVCSNSPPPDTSPEQPTGIRVELVDGSSSREGRVEIIRDGERGTVCDDQWDDGDAAVVCRMLGFRAGRAKTDGFYGPGHSSNPILLDDVDCLGSEASLADCIHAGWGIHNCGHGEDAGVSCIHSEAGGTTEPDGSNHLELSSVPCGRRPLEESSRKKREEPEEKELAPPPKFERIIGGFTASRGFYPWQVGVRRLVHDGVYSHWCGGTILGDFWILSAAHCFEDLNKGHVLVRTGDHDNKVEDSFEQEFELDRIINHPQYNGETYDFDIALLKIKPKNGAGIQFSDHVQPACLPETNTAYTAGQKCHISGWGKTEYGYQNLLKSARVPLIGDQQCEGLYKSITRNMVCAGYLIGGIDSCAGDSGGPLVCEIDGRYTVMGATSWGAGCAEANAPGVYARVTVLLPWIKRNIELFSTEA